MDKRCCSLSRMVALVLAAAFAHGVSAAFVPSDRSPQAGTIVAYAGEPGGLVLDGVAGARNSPYVEALLRYLEAPLDVGLMLRWIRDAVLESTSGQQKPVAHVSLSGRSVYLARNPALPPSKRQPAKGAEHKRKRSRVALTVGNSAYEHANPLVNPLSDAAAVASALERLGFLVSRLENTDRAELERGLGEFREKVLTAEIAVVYYVGHGVEVAGNRFLVPVDAKIESPADIDAAAVPLDLVMHALEPTSVLRLILLDAMFVDPWKNNGR